MGEGTSQVRLDWSLGWSGVARGHAHVSMFRIFNSNVCINVQRSNVELLFLVANSRRPSDESTIRIYDSEGPQDDAS